MSLRALFSDSTGTHKYSHRVNKSSFVNRPILTTLELHDDNWFRFFPAPFTPLERCFARQAWRVECLNGASGRPLFASVLPAPEDRQQWASVQMCLFNLYGKWLFSQVDYIRQWPLRGPREARCVIISTQTLNSTHALHAIVARLSWCPSSWL